MDAPSRYRAARVAHWDRVHASSRRGLGGAYQRRLVEVFRTLVPPGRRVLELGCGEGSLLAALAPSTGVGIDFSPEAVRAARARHPRSANLTFLEADVHDLPETGEPFDYILLSETLNDAFDVQRVLEAVRTRCHRGTRVVINFYSRLWGLPLSAARRLGLARPNLPQNWLTVPDLVNLLDLAGFQAVRAWPEVLLPLPVPLLAPLANRVLVKTWPLRHLGLTNFVLARPVPGPVEALPLVSVVVPARNEAGNVAAVFEKTPEMGCGTEIVFVEGGSTDGTWEAIGREADLHAGRRSARFRQEGSGKGDAVRLGFARAKGDLLVILDADLTVPPEDLPRFVEVLLSGKAEFANGVRLVYPMDEEAMRPLNFLGNKFFSLAFTWLLGQPVKDTLCGTKVLWRSDWERIVAGRAAFGDFDPFGDFDLLFGAARLGLKFAEIPVRYRERTYGTTNISRFRHGALLLRMVAFAAARIKFV